MERGRKNRKTTASLLARGSHTVVRILSLCVCVSDDPLLILLGPSNGDYWSDQGTWGPWPEGAWLQHLHKTIPVFSSRGTAWGFCFSLVQEHVFYIILPMTHTPDPDSSQLVSHVLLQCLSCLFLFPTPFSLGLCWFFPHGLPPRWLHSP